MSAYHLAPIHTLYSKLLRSHHTLFNYNERREIKLWLKQYYQPANYEQPAFGHTLADKLCIADTIFQLANLEKKIQYSILHRTFFRCFFTHYYIINRFQHFFGRI